MKIIIAGDGKVGSTLARELSAEGYDLTMIDSRAQVLEQTMEKYDIITVNGNCAAMSTLHQAGVESADLLIAATGADELNLLCCMTAHCMNAELHTIARIRNPEYTEQAYRLRGEFALSMTVNPERQAAVEIERLLSLPGFLRRDTFAKGRAEMVELRIDAQSRLAGVALHGLNSIVKCKVLVCAVLRGGQVIMPGGGFVLLPGDRVYVTAPTGELVALLKNLGIITRKVTRVMLAGGGRISYYLAQQLSHSGIRVQIIEKDLARCTELAGLLPQVSVIEGDASSQSLLEREGVGSCDALVSLTGLDETNLMISMYGAHLGVPQVITKLSRLENSPLLDSLPIGSVVFPRELVCNTIVRYVRAIKNQTGAAISVHTIAAGQAEATEYHVDETTQHCREPLKKISLRPNVLMACISHRGMIEIPDGDSSFDVGDTVVIVTSADTVIGQLNEIFA